MCTNLLRMPRKNRLLLPFHTEVEFTVHDLDSQGWGVGDAQGVRIRAAYVLPGEKVRARIFRSSHGGCDADVIELLEPSPLRLQAVCSLFGTCSGCQLQHMPYAEQLSWKKRKVKSLFPDVQESVLRDVVPSPLELGYRAKITPHFTRDEEGISSIGFIEHGRRSRILDVPNCPLASAGMNTHLTELRKKIQQDSSQYKRGATLLIREGIDGVVSDGRAIVREQVGPWQFEFPASSFFQNNRSILPAFVTHVIEAAWWDGAEVLIDAHCGCGLFSIAAAGRFSEVIGVEVADQSIALATHNAEKNGCKNVRFIMGEAAVVLTSFNLEGKRGVVVLDPPRKGCGGALLDALKKTPFERIVYVSCKPETMAADIQSLAKAGYRLTELQPFDLFPQTAHVECVAVLQHDPS